MPSRTGRPQEISPSGYLVRESKSDLTLREDEKAQFACGKAHFKAVEVPSVTVMGFCRRFKRAVGNEDLDETVST